MNSLTEQILVNVIKSELSIDDNHCFIRNQNFKVPSDEGLFVVLGLVDSKIMSSNNEVLPVSGGMEENQIVLSAESIQFDVYSRDNSALLRRYEVLQALSSIYCQQQQELNNFRIFQIPHTFINSSEAEGGSRLNRFTIVVTCHVWNLKQKSKHY